MAVREANERDFAELVVAASHRVPVLVDFWAPWCGPCRMLAPVLDAIAAKMEGRLAVVKVNVDENPNLAAQYGVRGIPSVKLFVNGKIVAEFTGAQPQGWIEDWLEEHLPRKADREAEQALALFEAGRRDAAIARALAAVEEDPSADRARLKLIWMLLEEGRKEEAEAHWQRLSARAKASADGEALKQRIEILRRGGDLDALAQAVQAQPNDASAWLRYGDALAAAARYEEAMQAYLQAMRLDRGKLRDEARQGMLRVFEVLGGRGELVDRYRSEMASVLFS